MMIAIACGTTHARDFITTVTEMDHLPRVRPEFKIPDEPNQLFFVQRSVNSNTVIYAANLDAQGNIDRKSPVDAFWRWFNVDGHKKPLNFIERMLAYGVRVNPAAPKGPITFTIAALPDRPLRLSLDDKGHPEALMQIGTRTVKVVYVYLEVIDRGLTPEVPWLDVFGIDKMSKKVIHEHAIQK